MELQNVLLLIAVIVLWGRGLDLARRVAALERQLQGQATPGVDVIATPAPASPRPAAAPSASTPARTRAPVSLQRWLARIGVVATLLGVASLLAALEHQGVIGGWWRLLAGLALGTAFSAQAAREARAHLSAARPWTAEAYAALGVSVTLLTLTAAARAAPGPLWPFALALATLGAVMLARSWNGVTTPLAALLALGVALLNAHVTPGPELWNLDRSALGLLTVTFAATGLLPLADHRPGAARALPAAALLALITACETLTLSGTLQGGRNGQQEVLLLITGAAALCGLLAPTTGGVAARSLAAGLALSALSASVVSLLSADARVTVPLAAALAALLLLLPDGVTDRPLRQRLAASAGLLAALSGAAELQLVHFSGARLGSARFEDHSAGYALASVLAGLLPSVTLRRWTWGAQRPATWSATLAAAALSGLAFGPAGLPLPLLAFPAVRRDAGRFAAPLLLWALLSFPLLSFSGPSSGWAALLERALLIASSLLLTLLAAWQLTRAHNSAWLHAALLGWSGAWLLATLLPVSGLGAWALTTPWLALSGGWLLRQAQPLRAGRAAWNRAAWNAGGVLLLLALGRLLLGDLSGETPVLRAAGLLGAGIVTLLAAVRFPPPGRHPAVPSGGEP